MKQDIFKVIYLVLKNLKEKKMKENKSWYIIFIFYFKLILLILFL